VPDYPFLLTRPDELADYLIYWEYINLTLVLPFLLVLLSFHSFYYSPSILFTTHYINSPAPTTLQIWLIARSMDQIFSLIRLSLTCTLVVLLLLGLYLLFPTRHKITLIGSINGPKLGNGLNVIESAIAWCPSLKEGFRPSWWLPK
jgi:hypothetical protein